MERIEIWFSERERCWVYELYEIRRTQGEKGGKMELIEEGIFSETPWGEDPDTENKEIASYAARIWGKTFPLEIVIFRGDRWEKYYVQGKKSLSRNGAPIPM
jgi:hypothetical protein